MQLRAEVAAYLLRDIMSTSVVLQQLDKLTRQLLAAQMTPRMVAPGHDLCLQVVLCCPPLLPGQPVPNNVLFRVVPRFHMRHGQHLSWLAPAGGSRRPIVAPPRWCANRTSIPDPNPDVDLDADLCFTCRRGITS